MESFSTSHDMAAPWGPDEAGRALAQVADLCRKFLHMDVQTAVDQRSFRSVDGKAGPHPGVVSVSAKLASDDLLVLNLELVRGPGAVRPEFRELAGHLAELGDKVHFIPPPEPEKGETSLWVALKVMARPMGPARSGGFTKELKRIDALARTLRAAMPRIPPADELDRVYKDFSDVLSPITPLDGPGAADPPELGPWSGRVLDLLTAGVSVAVVSPYPVLSDLALSLVAKKIMAAGSSLARVLLPAVNSKILLDLAGKAPGMLALPAVRLSMGNNPYELGNEVQNLLNALSQAGRSVVFTGAMAQQQAVFAGGQGADQDPLLPAVCHVPEVDFPLVARFAVESAALAQGGVAPKILAQLAETAVRATAHAGDGQKQRLLPMVAQKILRDYLNGNFGRDTLRQYVADLGGRTETLAGLSHKPRVARSSEVQENFARNLCQRDFKAHLKTHLLAQDTALDHLTARLRTEILTRPRHQPLRCLVIGTPGTGKSESALLTARYLSIPYVYIDAASLPDHYTALAQFYGSGRGIVGSHKAGRLEQGAKHHTGVLFEIADLDHAPPSVRSALADSFLQPLETGEAQSATGAMFSCANVIFFFSMNLPEGKDESVRRSMGFSPSPGREQILENVVGELKTLVSGAFMSRLGTPIVFDPLDGRALAHILEKAIVLAVIQAAKGLHANIKDVVLEKDLGNRLLTRISADIVSFGARALLEHGRSLAARGFLAFAQKAAPHISGSLEVTLTKAGQLLIQNR